MKLTIKCLTIMLCLMSLSAPCAAMMVALVKQPVGAPQQVSLRTKMRALQQKKFVQKAQSDAKATFEEKKKKIEEGFRALIKSLPAQVRALSEMPHNQEAKKIFESLKMDVAWCVDVWDHGMLDSSSLQELMNFLVTERDRAEDILEDLEAKKSKPNNREEIAALQKAIDRGNFYRRQCSELQRVLTIKVIAGDDSDF